MQLESMYQEIILDHYRNPHHKGLREPFDAEVHHVNPVCGDEVPCGSPSKTSTASPWWRTSPTTRSAVRSARPARR